jgi:hypothetical protein
VANSRAIVLASAGLAVPLKVVNSLFTLASCRIAIKPPDHHGAIFFGRARQKLDKKIRRFGRGYLDGRQLLATRFRRHAYGSKVARTAVSARDW